MMQLISLFQDQGYSITFASTATASERSEEFFKQEIRMLSIVLNDSSFDEFI